jgi:LmbE family N-acetylglucosaminyl deacetylase
LVTSRAIFWASIRTQELLAARRIDGAEQFFTRAVDFGYSKGPDETLAKWGHDEVLATVVRVIRTFRPDVIVMRFPTTGEGRHGHHTASAMLAVEAFEAAGDPSRFPDQFKRSRPGSRSESSGTLQLDSAALGRRCQRASQDRSWGLQRAPRPFLHGARRREPEHAQEPGIRIPRTPRHVD